MRVKQHTLINAQREDIATYLQSPEFTQALVTHLGVVHQIELQEEHREGTTLTRVMRYSARTQDQIPSFLKKYESSAPEFVHWRQIETWDTQLLSMTYTIKAEIKDEWQKYYTTHGKLELIAAGGAQTSMHATLDYKVNVFGLGKLIEKAARKEVTKILARQGEVVSAHFE